MHIAATSILPLLLWSLEPATSPPPPADPETPTAEEPAATTTSQPAAETPQASPTPPPAEPPPATATVVVTAEPAPPPPDVPPAPAAPPPEPPKLDLPTFEFGVEAFLRPEARINGDFNSSNNEDGSNPAQIHQRIRLQMMARYKWLTVFAQLQDVRLWGFESNTSTNEANTDLHQGYVEMGGKNEKVLGWIRAGRQEINWGNQRLIGALNWAPLARAFDGLRAYMEFGKFGIDAFAIMLNRQQNFTVAGVDGAADRTVRNNGSQLYGGQVFGKVHPLFGFEVQVLAVDLRPIESANTRRLTLASPGVRLFGNDKGITYEAEAHVQAGKNGGDDGQDHLAWAWQANVGYALQKVKTNPGLSIGYAMASGNECTGTAAEGGCGNTESNEFFNFYPTNHLYYGFVDTMGWRNMRELNVKFALKPHAVFNIQAAYHFIQLHEETGAWKNAVGDLVGTGWNPNNDENTLGHEFDLTLNIKPFKQLFLQPGYGVFVPTEAGRTIGGPDPQHFLWLWLIVNLGSV